MGKMRKPSPSRTILDAWHVVGGFRLGGVEEGEVVDVVADVARMDGSAAAQVDRFFAENVEHVGGGKAMLQVEARRLDVCGFPARQVDVKAVLVGCREGFVGAEPFDHIFRQLAHDLDGQGQLL